MAGSIIGRLEGGEIIKFSPGAGVKVLDGDTWVDPGRPITGGMVADSTPLSPAEIEALTSRGVELK